MAKSKKLVGFRMGEEKEELRDDYWDIYPNHLYIPNDYWTISTSADEFDEKLKKKKVKKKLLSKWYLLVPNQKVLTYITKKIEGE